MAQVHHKRATTTHAIRAKLLRSKKSVATLGKCYNISPKIMRRWRARYSVEDVPMCPSPPPLNINDTSPSGGSRCSRCHPWTTACMPCMETM